MIAGISAAHEIRPAISNIEVSDETVSVDILFTAEAIVAGLNLADLADTNESPLSDQYDRLRKLEPTQLELEFRKIWPGISNKIKLSAGDQILEPDLQSIVVEQIGDIELPRESVLKFSALLPGDGSPVTLGWDASFGPLVVRQVLPEGGGYSGYLTNGAISEPIPRTGSGQQSWFSTFTNYIAIGFEHIVPKGLDHILFVLGLFFFSMKLRPILMQVTAFTVAHTVTLALAILGIVQIPASIVEPLIAASIVYIAIENIFFNNYRPIRTAVVFAFGLLHGLGFASVLGEIGLEPSRFVTGLIGFNVGVELGQLAVIAAAFLLVGYWFGQKEWYRRVIAIPISLAIALVGAYWFFERVF